MEERIKRLERIVKEQNDDIRALTAVVYEMRQHIPGPIYSLGELRLPPDGGSNIAHPMWQEVSHGS